MERLLKCGITGSGRISKVRNLTGTEENAGGRHHGQRIGCPSKEAFQMTTTRIQVKCHLQPISQPMGIAMRQQMLFFAQVRMVLMGHAGMHQYQA